MCKATFDASYKVRDTNNVLPHKIQQPILLRKILQMLFHFYSFRFKLNLVLINRPAHNSGLAKAAIIICAKIEHSLGSLRQAAKRYA